MNGEVEFRMIVEHEDLAAQVCASMIRREGFEVYDLLESEIQIITDNTKIQDIYLVCCRGSLFLYEAFILKHGYIERTYEGVKTLF